ncbi:MAG: F0F1 ATP synthase subunit B [Verrucomicrobiota bacterium]
MTEVLTKFGLDWPKFLAQVIVFCTVYLILKRYAFGPILSVLQDRRQRIEEGEANLEKISKDLTDAEERSSEIIAEANSKAEALITEARESAEAISAKKTQEAVNEAKSIVEKAREAAQLERDQALAELKRDFSRLVVNTTSKVTGKVLTNEDQQKINSEAAAQVSN